MAEDKNGKIRIEYIKLAIPIASYIFGSIWWIADLSARVDRLDELCNELRQTTCLKIEADRDHKMIYQHFDFDEKRFLELEKRTEKLYNELEAVKMFHMQVKK